MCPIEPVQCRNGELIEAEPFPGEVRSEYLLLLRPTLTGRQMSAKRKRPVYSYHLPHQTINGLRDTHIIDDPVVGAVLVHPIGGRLDVIEGFVDQLGALRLRVTGVVTVTDKKNRFKPNVYTQGCCYGNTNHKTGFVALLSNDLDQLDVVQI